ncbi:MAG: AraC family transcriptional regulator [Ruminococcaceae bacterium]|nr:AraC family transcriptional regulator [Oscillospiraceae bacterium]
MFKEFTRPAVWLLDVKKELPDFTKKTVLSPLHYGDTIEISFVRGIIGETYINGKRFEYKDKNVFLIPPKYLHTSVYKSGGSKKGDMICTFHINVNALESIVNIKNLLLKDNRTIFDLAFRCDDFDAMWETVQKILDENRSFISRIIDLLHLFEVIASQKSTDSHCVELSKTAAKLIDLIEENYKNKITVKDAADFFGYSTHYFCKWFKKETGATFTEFLNSVRIHHARIYLSSGYSVEQASEQCGFSDSSYFAKVFKNFVGVPPKTYALKVQKEKDCKNPW